MKNFMEKLNLSKKTKWIIGIIGAVILFSILSTCGGESEPEDTSNQHNESRQLEASTLKLKGVHASLFKVEGPYQVSLVKTQDKGWEVRCKFTAIKAKDIDPETYQAKLRCCNYIDYIDDFEVELISGQYDYEEFHTLLAKTVGESEEITLKPYQFDYTSYKTAKEIYDKLCGVIINDIELEVVEKDKVAEKTQTTTKTSTEENPDLKEVKEAAEDVKEILEAEIELVEALGGLL